MCDCYGHPCEDCGKVWEIHLGDFETGRDEVAVFCLGHIPENPGDGVAFVWDDSPEWEEEAGAVYIQALTRNAVLCADDNTPNLASSYRTVGYGALSGNRVKRELAEQ